MSTPKTEKTNSNLPLRNWAVYVQTEDNQTFGCGVYQAVTEEAAIDLGNRRVMNYQFIWQIYSEFGVWNQHQPKRLIADLNRAIQDENYDLAEAIAQQLNPHMVQFQNGNDEGKYWWERWQELRQAIQTAPRPPKQLNLFNNPQ